MRRRLATLAAVSVFALAVSAAPVAAGSPGSGGIPLVSGPLVHITLDSSELGSAPCGPNNERVYTFQEGGSLIFQYLTDSYTDQIHIAHWTLTNTWATDQAGTPYRVVGGETYNDLAGRLNLNIMFFSPRGGVVDRATFVARSYSHGGVGFWFDFGTCAV